MANYPLAEDRIAQLVEQALKQAIGEDIERAIEKAKITVENSIRERTAAIVMAVFSNFNVCRDGRDVLIRVKTNE